MSRPTPYHPAAGYPTGRAAPGPVTGRQPAEPVTSPSVSGHGARRRPAGLALAGACVLALALAACSAGSGASGASPSSSASPTTAAQDGAAPPDGGGGRFPGVSGEIAAVAGSTAQVQDSDSQTAVTWNADTAVLVQTDGTLADVTVGSCLTVATAADDDSETPVASSVSVSPAVDGTCDLDVPEGARQAPGGDLPDRPSGAPSDFPSDMPTDRPEGMPEGMPSDMPSGVGPGGGPAGWSGMRTSGVVGAIDGTTVTVIPTAVGQTEAADEVRVAVADDTRFTVTAAGTAEAVVVGQCLSARGDESDDGSLTATSMTVSAPTDGACTNRAVGRVRPDGAGTQGGGAEAAGDDA